jgi:DNA repair exonuclease SbcCD ATPase subunit|tara:strand:+ start:935 stop:2740 length:1806 start_codon:yes stop_codon:yes gene_type:complete
MKYVKFKDLKIKNFLSVGEDIVNIGFEKGLHVITGINRDKEDRRNGVGKSTVADALYFAIFGQTLRDLKKNFIANNLTGGTCEVQLTFIVDDPKHGVNEFDIIRTLNPSKCYVYKNGNDKTRDSITNTNEYISTVLSATPEIFQNCVIMTLNNHIPFMAKNKTEKRKFIEQIFNLEIFSKMLFELRNEHNEVKKNFDIEITRLEETNNYLTTQKGHRDNFNTDQEKKINSLNDTIDIHKNDLKEAQDKLSQIEALDDQPYKDKLLELENKLNESNDAKEYANHQCIEQKQIIKTNAEILKKLGTEEDTCPVCLRPMEDHDHKKVEEEKEYIRKFLVGEKEGVEACLKKMEDLNSEITKINSAIKMVNNKITEIGNKRYSIDHIKNSVKYIEKCITEIETEIEGVKKEKNTFSEGVNDLEEKINNIKNEISSLKKVINLMDVVKFVVSEEGVKSFIVKKILSHFNSKLTHFLKKLDSNCVCMFNEYFEEEIVNEKGKISLYNNFSGAERKAIDLACLFSFMDMRKAQGDVHYNISFYDELFDSSLDEKGVELVLEILNERVEKLNECVMVISHRKESIKSATGDVIFLEKHNGITKRVSFID